MPWREHDQMGREICGLFRFDFFLIHSVYNSSLNQSSPMQMAKEKSFFNYPSRMHFEELQNFVKILPWREHDQMGREI